MGQHLPVRRDKAIKISAGILVLPILFSPGLVLAQMGVSMGLCPVTLDIPPRPYIPEPLQENEIFITGEDVEYTEGGISELIGDGEFAYNEQQISADRIEYDEPLNKVVIEGNVNYWDNDVYLNSPGATINLNDDTGVFTDVNYWLLDTRGRGNARDIFVDLGVRTEGRRVDYSTCDPDLNSPWNLTTNIWNLSAGKLVLDHEADRGSGTNIILKVKDIPIFYMPYISFPISDRRKSGLLVPTFTSSNRNGLDFQILYYWNIAPEMDATITPRLISNSGLMMVGEYRYLMQRGNGEVNLEYLPNDSKADGEDRNLVSIIHRQSFLQRGYFALDYHRVSDQEYFEDFSSSLVGTSTRYLMQRAITRYSWYFNGGHRLSAYNSVSNYQIVDRNIPVTTRPYKRLPSTTISYSSPFENSSLNIDITGRFDYFTRGQDAALENVNGMRYDLYPSISYPINHLSYYVIPKIGYHYSGYHLEDNTVVNDDEFDRSVPILSLDSGLFFERDTSLFGESLIQTLEPRLYYLYVPERNQDDIPIFDTGQFNLNFASLFAENRFNGFDRIGDTNQLSFAVTSRLYQGNTGRLLGSFSLGQALYLKDRNVVLPGRPVQTDSFSTIISRFETNILENLELRGEYQWDPELKRTRKLSINVHYSPESGKVVNVGYRKNRSDPEARILNILDIEQSDVSFRWPLNPEWAVVGRWNYALEETRTLDLFGGVEYNSCCWAMRLVTRRFLSNIGGEYDSGIFLQFQLKGLAGMGQKTVDFLRMSIPGYENEF
jgi:LPS-assembly protein